jgi:hypothetical protein
MIDSEIYGAVRDAISSDEGDEIISTLNNSATGWDVRSPEDQHEEFVGNLAALICDSIQRAVGCENITKTAYLMERRSEALRRLAVAHGQLANIENELIQEGVNLVSL